MKRRGFLFILSSPSGAGKTTLSRLLLEREANLYSSVSMTTRAPRPQEKDGRDYFFITPEVFEEHVQNDYFCEHTTLFSHRYGTPMAPIQERLAHNMDVLFDVDGAGAQNLKNKFPGDVVSVFILPPSLQELKRRLIQRCGDKSSVLQQRLEGAHHEIQYWRSYDYVIINKELETALQALCSIVTAERLRRIRQEGLSRFVKTLQETQ